MSSYNNQVSHAESYQQSPFTHGHRVEVWAAVILTTSVALFLISTGIKIDTHQQSSGGGGQGGMGGGMGGGDSYDVSRDHWLF